MVDIRRGGLALHPTGQSVEAAMTEWLAAAKAGSVRTRGRVPYAPSTLASLEKSYRVCPMFCVWCGVTDITV